MPNYKYRCTKENCQHAFETYHSIKADFIRKCPVCESISLEIVIQPATVIFPSEPKSVGALAERNTAQLGRYEREALWDKQEKHQQEIKEAARREIAAKLPSTASLPELMTGEAPWRPGTNKAKTELANLTVEQTEKYIFKGESP